MPTILPITPPNRTGFVASFTQRLQTWLGDIPVVFDFRWNSSANGRRGAWFMDVYDENVKPIAKGVKLVLGVALCRTSLHPVFLNGVLVLRPNDGDRREPAFSDLGTRVELWYYTRAEMIEGMLALS